MGAILAMDGTFSPVEGGENVWLFVAQPPLVSRDFRYHIDWLLRRFADRHERLQALRARGCRVEILCFWESISGNGGPTLDRELLIDLSKFPLDRLGFDFRIDEPPWGSEPSITDPEPKSQVVPPAPNQKYSPVEGRTYVTLLIYHDELSPGEIGARLALDADRVVHRGQIQSLGVVPRRNGWFYGSESHLESYDVGLHLDWLMDRLASRHRALQWLKERGSRIDITCFWESAANASGPALSATVLTKLSELPLDEIWFDVYFDDPNAPHEDAPSVGAPH